MVEYNLDPTAQHVISFPFLHMNRSIKVTRIDIFRK